MSVSMRMHILYTAFLMSLYRLPAEYMHCLLLCCMYTIYFAHSQIVLCFTSVVPLLHLYCTSVAYALYLAHSLPAELVYAYMYDEKIYSVYRMRRYIRYTAFLMSLHYPSC